MKLHGQPVANVLTSGWPLLTAEKWDGYEMALLLLQHKCRATERVENKECTCTFLLKSSSADLLLVDGLCFRIRIDFNIRKFRVTSQDKQQRKQIDGKMHNLLVFYERERSECYWKRFIPSLSMLSILFLGLMDFWWPLFSRIFPFYLNPLRAANNKTPLIIRNASSTDWTVNIRKLSPLFVLIIELMITCNHVTLSLLTNLWACLIKRTMKLL